MRHTNTRVVADFVLRRDDELPPAKTFGAEAAAMRRHDVAWRGRALRK